MSTWLADSVAAYVERLTERDFDAPFTALLHQRGFTQVHFTHGQYEFGKDFIARSEGDGTPVQWCFQTKAGDIGASAWRTELHPQIDMMREGTRLHPGFDPTLDRRIVVVTTGRLKGSVGISMHDANEHARARGEIEAELWDADFLIPALQECLIAERDPRDQARILEMVGQLQLGRGSRTQLMSLATDWIGADSSEQTRWGDVLTGCLLTHEAARAGREDLAMQVLAQLIRSYHQRRVEGPTPDPQILEVVHGAFEATVAQFWEQVRDTSDPVELTLRATSGWAAIGVHPIKVARLCEFLSLYVLWLIETDRRDEAEEVGAFLSDFTGQTPALSHLAGEEWAYSVLITAAALAATGHTDRAQSVVRKTTVWLLDRLEDGRKIAPVGARSAEVVDEFIGTYFGGRTALRDTSMYALTVVVDAAILLGDDDLARDMVHDVDIYRALASTYVPLSVGTARRVARVDYRDHPVTAEHHSDASSDVWPVTSMFDSAAIWATSRDRHLPGVLRPLFASPYAH